jgi:hypothetical protein
LISPKFPAWLPPVIAKAAKGLLETDNPSHKIVLRLTTDSRMQRVWSEISKLKQKWQPLALTLAGHPRKGLGSAVKHPHRTDQEEALINTFLWAYLLARLPIGITTISELDALLASCEKMSRQLRRSAAGLRALPSRLSGSDHLDVEGIEYRLAEVHAKQIEDAAKFFDNAAATINELKDSAGFNPQIVNRPGHRRHRRARAYTRQLAAQINEPLYQTIATIASVALDCSVTKEQVIEWTRGVDRPQK